MTGAEFQLVVARAALAPSVHNTQPARWCQVPGGIEVLCDGDVRLRVGDPEGRDAALSCGAAVEATVIALSALGHDAVVTELWDGPGPGLQPVARIAVSGEANADVMADQLERRFTWRGMFDPAPAPLFGWDRSDTVTVTDPARKAWIAGLNDEVSLRTLRDGAFRAELLDWMRLLPWHRRYRLDGLNREALQMSPALALGARLVLGPLWGLCDALGLTRAVTAEAEATRAAQVIACFHRPAGESPVASGRAYLRMCLEAAHLGMAGWPMAALADDAETRGEMAQKLGIGPERRLIQVIRFGVPVGAAPPRVRLPVAQLIV